MNVPGTESVTPRRPVKAVRLLIALLVLFGGIGCDQATKRLATEHLRGRPGISYFNDTFRLEYALNSGGFLSVGNNLSLEVRRWIFVGFNTVVLLGLAGYVLVRWDMRLSTFIAAVAVLSGGIGNLIDRVSSQGLVTDFLNLGIGPLRTGIFNVADMAVSFGVIVLLWNMRTPEKPTAPPGEDTSVSRP